MEMEDGAQNLENCPLDPINELDGGSPFSLVLWGVEGAGFVVGWVMHPVIIGFH